MGDPVADINGSVRGRAALSVEDLTMHYLTRHGTVRAVDGVSFGLEPGGSMGLVGESGCGKSSIALSLMNLLPDNGRLISGRVILGGEDLLAMDGGEVRDFRWRRVAMVFQAAMNAMDPVYRVGDQIVEAIQNHGVETRKDAARERVARLFDVVGLPRPVATRFPHELSGGMRQRAMIAMALSCEPDLIIADEPTTALDVIVQDRILRELKRIQQELGMSLLYITHDIAVVAEVADRTGVMYAGQLVEVGDTAQLFRQAMHPYTRALLSSFPSVVGGETTPGDAARGAAEPDSTAAGLPVPSSLSAGNGHLPDGDAAPGEVCRRVGRMLASPGRGGAGSRAGCRRGGLGWRLTWPVRLESMEDPRPWCGWKGWPSCSRWGAGLLRGPTGYVHAVDGVDFEIPRGETLGLVGESGSGKTTVGRLLVKLLEPTEGRILFLGLPEETGQDGRESEGQSGGIVDTATLKGAGLREFRRRAQMVFQDPYESMNPRRTVFDTVAEPLNVQGMGTRQQRLGRVSELLGLVGLTPPSAYLFRFPHELSGGQRQRVAVARALVVGPSFVVADEPTSMLDVSIRTGIMTLMQELGDRLGITYLYVTHDLAVARYMCRRIAVMYSGKIVELGETEELLSHPQHPYTQGAAVGGAGAGPRLPEGGGGYSG